jgi:hypothetical protein
MTTRILALLTAIAFVALTGCATKSASTCSTKGSCCATEKK